MNMDFGGRVTKENTNTRDVHGIYNANNEDIRSEEIKRVTDKRMPSSTELETSETSETINANASTANTSMNTGNINLSLNPEYNNVTQVVGPTNTMKTVVFCKLLFEGIHNWPTCNIPEVEYLKHPHRHIFHITCEVNVLHNDRDKEFIVLKHDVEAFLKRQFPSGNLGSTSCEQLAQMLMSKFDLDMCEVSEDGENGARVTKTNIANNIPIPITYPPINPFNPVTPVTPLNPWNVWCSDPLHTQGINGYNVETSTNTVPLK